MSWEQMPSPTSFFEKQVLTHSGIVDGILETNSIEVVSSISSPLRDSSKASKRINQPNLVPSKQQMEDICEEVLSQTPTPGMRKHFITKDSNSDDHTNPTLYQMVTQAIKPDDKIMSPLIQSLNEQINEQLQRIDTLQQEIDSQSATMDQLKRCNNQLNIKLHEQILQSQYEQDMLREEVLFQHLLEIDTLTLQQQEQQFIGQTIPMKTEQQIREILEKGIAENCQSGTIVEMVEQFAVKFQSMKSQLLEITQARTQQNEEHEQLKVQISKLSQKNLVLKQSSSQLDRIEQKLACLGEIRSEVHLIKEGLTNNEQQRARSSTIEHLKKKINLLESQRQFQRKLSTLLIASPSVGIASPINQIRNKNCEELLNKQLTNQKLNQEKIQQLNSQSKPNSPGKASEIKCYDLIPSPSILRCSKDPLELSYQNLHIQERFENSIHNSQKILKQLDSRYDSKPRGLSHGFLKS